MDKKYSPSKLNTFNGCKLQFKYAYIDHLRSDLKTIENFMGSRVHEAMENFYRMVKSGRVESLDWLLDEYRNSWNKNFDDSIKIVKKELTALDYFNKGKQGIIDYYNRYKPFNQNKIVEMEYRANFCLQDYLIEGYIDRLDWNDREGIFEIHDYKTTSRLMTQEEADNDWQLGIYQVAVKDKWPEAKKVKLVWHAMSFNKDIVSFRTEKQTEDLKKNILAKIKEIETCENFPPEKSALCHWCKFQDICPLWKHLRKMEAIPPNEYKNDSGVKLVSSYKKLEEEKNEFKEKIKSLEEEQKKIEEAAIDFAKKNDILVIDGPDSMLKVDIRTELKAPTKSEDEEKWQKLRETLIKENKYQEVSTVNNNMMNYRMKQWPAEFMGKIKNFLIQKTNETVKLIKK